MSLRELLESLIGRIEGAHAIMLMGRDCIAVDEVRRDTAGFDVQAMAVEYATVVKDIRRSIDVVGAGDLEEMTVTTANAVMVVRILNEEFFAVMVLSRDANPGKARFLLSTVVPELIRSVE
ncbi:roadblock/LC7 domain-containing protein [Trichlorobacter ammonificans]|uniref:Roadblock/LAMTOR2 domain-containing protein n=1 Tax=Trichlorobacter ammonificans TaxID=2916410 RepID=A0ABM9DCK6_9BACT|nr:roadblock/LC7 domain-containing protein [Trichlorobacter ammonificans]CAH2032163.1 conserved protein of unknown function [Trichlorobacter ammonificans]